MTDTATNSSVCPRCDSTDVRVMTTSPVPGRWTMFVCDVCIYSWRSIEPSYATDPTTYPATFKIRPEDIPGLAVFPTLPPLLP